MIDVKVFKAEFSVLVSRFNYTPDEVVAKRYYQALSDRMSTEQFKAAVATCFVEDDVFPSPKRLIGLVEASSAELALVEWDAALLDIQRGVFDLSRYSAAAGRAFQSVGGLHAIGMADIQKQLPFMKKDFLSAYRVYSSAPVQQLLPENNQPKLTGSDGGLTRVGC